MYKTMYVDYAIVACVVTAVLHGRTVVALIAYGGSAI